MITHNEAISDNGSLPETESTLNHEHERMPNEVIIPLTADMMFFQTLSTAIEDLSAHMVTVQSDFVDTLQSLSRTIGDSARPTSSTTTFRPHSGLTSKPWSVHAAGKAKVRYLALPPFSF